MRARQNPPVTMPPATFDYEMWTGPAPMLPYTSLTDPRSWRAFMEYGNGKGTLRAGVMSWDFEPKGAAWWATTKRIACCSGRTARPGGTRTRQRCRSGM